MSWLDPSLLRIGLALTALLLVGLWSHAGRRRRLAEFLGGRRAVARLARRDLYGRRLGRSALLLAAGVALAAAAGEPYWPDAPEPVPPTRRTVIALDVSASMQADDVSPTRLARAVEVAGRLIDELDEHEIGLLLFAGTPYPLAPPTRDHQALRFLLRGVTPTMASAQDPGTTTSAALDAAVALLERPRGATADGEESGGQAAPAEERHVVLIGDGDAGAPDAELEAAVERVVESGARVHVVGVGTATGAGIVMPAGTYQLGGPVVDARGARVVSSLREPALRALAEQGRGRYAGVDDEVALEALVEAARARPAAVPPPTAEARPVWASRDLPFLLGALALGLVVLEGLLEAARPRAAALRVREAAR